MTAEPLWDLDLPTLIGEYRGTVGYPARDVLAYNSGRDLTLRGEIDPPVLLSPVDDFAARICRAGGSYVPVRVLRGLPAAGTQARYEIEAVLEPPTRHYGGDIRVWVHDLVLDDEARRQRSVEAVALESLSARLAFDVGGEQCVVAVRWEGSNDTLGLVTSDRMIADCSLRADGWVLHRIRPDRRSKDNEGWETREVLVGTLILTGHTPQQMVRQGVIRLDTLGGRLWPVYVRATLAEFTQIAAATISPGVLPLVRSTNPNTGDLVYRLPSPDATAGITTVVAGSRERIEGSLEALTHAMSLPEDEERLGRLAESLAALRENPRGDVTSVGVDFKRGDPEPGAVAAVLDIGMLTQSDRRWKSLCRYRSDAGHGPLRVVLGAKGPPAARRPLTVTDMQIDRALGSTATAAQASAIRVALNSPDVALIQGPPGTGKTRVIGAIRRLLMEHDGEQGGLANVLLASTQNEAVDNLVRSQIRPDAIPADRRADAAKRGDVDAQVDGWAQDWSQRITSASPEAPPSLSVVRSLVHDCVSKAFGQGNAALPGIRRELEGPLRGHFPGPQVDLWLQKLQGPPEATGLTSEQRLLIRLIRTDPHEYQDDGRFTVQRLLRTLDQDSLAIDLTLLRELADRPTLPTKDQLKKLRQLKDLLLKAAIGPTGIPASATQTLAEIAEAVAEQLSRSAEGAITSLQTLAEQLRTHPAAVAELVEQFSDARAVTCQTAVATSPEPEGARSALTPEPRITLFETVIVDEASRTPPVDLLVSAEKARRRVVLVGDQRQLPHFVDEAVREALDKEDRRLFANPLFAALFDELKERQPLDGVSRVVTLTDQFRMHPRLGDFVSRSFYEPEVRIRSARSSEEFAESITTAGRRVALWLDVDSPAAQRPDFSWERPAESAAVTGFLEKFLPREPDLSVGVISFYAAQVEGIQAHLQAAGMLSDSLAATPSSNPSHLPDRLWVGTVDACQGREFDVVILSCVRSRGADGRFGHLSDANRMCVALSRARRLMVGVGDRRHFTSPRAERSVPWLHAFVGLCQQEESRYGEDSDG